MCAPQPSCVTRADGECDVQALDKMLNLKSSMQQEQNLVTAMAHELFEQARFRLLHYAYLEAMRIARKASALLQSLRSYDTAMPADPHSHSRRLRICRHLAVASGQVRDLDANRGVGGESPARIKPPASLYGCAASGSNDSVT